MLRSSRPEVFCEKGVLKNFANFTEKHLRWKLQHKCLPVKLAKFLRPPFSQDNSGGCFSMFFL